MSRARVLNNVLIQKITSHFGSWIVTAPSGKARLTGSAGATPHSSVSHRRWQTPEYLLHDLSPPIHRQPSDNQIAQAAAAFAVVYVYVCALLGRLVLVLQ